MGGSTQLWERRLLQKAPGCVITIPRSIISGRFYEKIRGDKIVPILVLLLESKYYPFRVDSLHGP
jgi:hypothetical protein